MATNAMEGAVFVVWLHAAAEKEYENCCAKASVATVVFVPRYGTLGMKCCIVA